MKTQTQNREILSNQNSRSAHAHTHRECVLIRDLMLCTRLHTVQFSHVLALHCTRHTPGALHAGYVLRLGVRRWALPSHTYLQRDFSWPPFSCAYHADPSALPPDCAATHARPRCIVPSCILSFAFFGINEVARQGSHGKKLCDVRQLTP